MELYGYNGESPTVNSLFEECTDGNVDKYVTVQQLQKVAGKYLVPMEHRLRCTEMDLYDVLTRKKPPIALVNYGTIQLYTDVYDTKFKGGHFVVVIGMTHEDVFYFDPLFPSKSLAQPSKISIDGWMQSWMLSVNDGNIPCQMLVPMNPIGEKTPQINSLYRIRVTPYDGVNIRRTPKVALGNVIGGLPYGEEKDIYFEERISSKELWLSISPKKDSWIAGIYNSNTYTEKI